MEQYDISVSTNSLYLYIRTMLGGLNELVRSLTDRDVNGIEYTQAADLLSMADTLSVLIAERLLIPSPDHDDYLPDIESEGNDGSN